VSEHSVAEDNNEEKEKEKLREKEDYNFQIPVLQHMAVLPFLF